MMTQRGFQTMDAYIGAQPEAVQPVLRVIRSVIARAAPEATKKISYQVPTFYLHGNLVHFAAFPKHIVFYPTPSGVTAFHNEL